MALPPKTFYEDLPLDPTINSKGDISTVTNLDAIKQSLRMIIETAAGTRIFLPNYGAKVKAFLFEPFDQSTATQIGTQIEESINNYEQRIQLLSVNVIMVQATTSYNVSITYLVLNQQQVDTLQITLGKL